MFIKDILDISFFTYIVYFTICTKKPWFDLTANYRLLGFGGLVFLSQNFWFVRATNKNNYAFYKRNQQLLDNLLTKEDKK
jgi:hypothetical protein